MYPNYNYYPQNSQPSGVPAYSQSYLRPAQPQIGLKGRMVTSLEEARATSIDFDGSVFYFPDLASKRIYTKQINMDGTASLNVYELRELPVENNKVQYVASTENFVTREEFEQVIAKLRASLIPEQTIVTAPQTPPKKMEVLDF